MPECRLLNNLASSQVMVLHQAETVEMTVRNFGIGMTVKIIKIQKKVKTKSKEYKETDKMIQELND